METIEKLTKIRLIIRVIVIDLIVLVGAAVLVADNPSRWPILLAVGPVLFFVNFIGIQRLKREDERQRPMLLPVFYGGGVLLSFYWILEDFQWWKCLSLAVALLLLGTSLLRQRKDT